MCFGKHTSQKGFLGGLKVQVSTFNVLNNLHLLCKLQKKVKFVKMVMSWTYLHLLLITNIYFFILSWYSNKRTVAITPQSFLAYYGSSSLSFIFPF